MASNFFEQQEQARRVTSRLVILLTIAVVVIVGVISFVCHGAFNFNVEEISYKPALWSAGLTVLVIVGGTWHHMRSFANSGSSIATMLGGVRVYPSSGDDLERRLLNVVEEMAIASGIPVPQVYVLNQEEGINAFAAGAHPTDAVVGVTRGTLTKLNRDELQGVIAHEFSHIFNGDMMINLRLVGLLGGLVVLFVTGRLVLQFFGRGRTRGSRNSIVIPILLIGLTLTVFGYIGVIFAKLIKAAVSRQREFLADATAVQYTRNPLGIGGALMKIRDDINGSRVVSPFAEEASHMFLSSISRTRQLFATHPAIDKRIERILQHRRMEPSRVQTSLAHGPHVGVSIVATMSSEKFTTSISEVTVESLQCARELISSLPKDLVQAARTEKGAMAVLLALLVGKSKSRANPTPLIRLHLGEEMVALMSSVMRSVSGLSVSQRLPIVEMAHPALRAMEEQKRRAFLTLIRDVIHIDNDYSLFEFVIYTLLSGEIKGPQSKKLGLAGLNNDILIEDVEVLLSALANIGARDDRAATDAYLKGGRKLPRSLRNFRPVGKDVCTGARLEVALNRLKKLRPTDKGRVIEACAEVVLADSKMEDAEYEVLKSICVFLDVPTPLMPVSAA